LYKGEKDEIEIQSAKVNLRLLLGRTKHFKRQQVSTTIMQPAIRAQLNDWIALPRYPSINAWILETRLTQKQYGELQEYLQPLPINLQAQTQPPPAIKSDTETAVEPEKVQTPDVPMPAWKHQAKDLAQRSTFEATAYAGGSETTVSLPVCGRQPMLTAPVQPSAHGFGVTVPGFVKAPASSHISDDDARDKLMHDIEESQHSHEPAGITPENEDLGDGDSLSFHRKSSDSMEPVETPTAPSEGPSDLQVEANSQLVPPEQPGAARRFLQFFWPMG
jgi:hypothetical protein